VSDDPLRTFIGRSLRADVEDVQSEVVARNASLEVERIRFRQNGEERSLVLKRLPPNDSLEVQLLPFLARKTDRVPAVHARGVPPPAAAGWPWILIEDLLDARSACNGDPLAIIRAKAAVERGVAGNEPALGALGVRRVTPIELVERASERTAIDRPIDVDARAAATYLSRLPVVLCQGELTCASARLTDRGVVLVEWRRAYLGCGLLDVARLAAEIAAFDDRDPGAKPFALYAELAGIALAPELMDAARLVDRVVRRRRSK